MKKITTIALAALLVVSALLTLGACGGDALKLDNSELTVYIGDSKALTVTYKDEKPSGTVTWKSSDNAIATVDDNGLIFGVAAGSATITAEFLVGAKLNSATCSVTVTEDPTKLFQLSYSAKNEENKVTDSTNIVFYNTGKIRLNGFVATYYPISLEFDYTVANSTIQVTPIATQALDCTEEGKNEIAVFAQLLAGLTGASYDDVFNGLIHVDVRDINITLVANILTVKGVKGAVEAPEDQMFGVFTLSEANATALGIVLAARVNIASLEFDSALLDEATKSTISITVGEQRVIAAKVTPENATVNTVSYTSSAADVVTVDAATGKIEAKKVGTAVITATATDDATKTDSYTVTVTAAPDGTLLAKGYTKEDGSEYTTLYFMNNGTVKVVGLNSLCLVSFETTYTAAEGALTAIATVDSADFLFLIGFTPVPVKVEFTVSSGIIVITGTKIADGASLNLGLFGLSAEEMALID